MHTYCRIIFSELKIFEALQQGFDFPALFQFQAFRCALSGLDPCQNSSNKFDI